MPASSWTAERQRTSYTGSTLTCAIVDSASTFLATCRSTVHLDDRPPTPRPPETQPPPPVLDQLPERSRRSGVGERLAPDRRSQPSTAHSPKPCRAAPGSRAPATPHAGTGSGSTCRPSTTAAAASASSTRPTHQLRQVPLEEPVRHHTVVVDPSGQRSPRRPASSPPPAPGSALARQPHPPVLQMRRDRLHPIFGSDLFIVVSCGIRLHLRRVLPHRDVCCSMNRCAALRSTIQCEIGMPERHRPLLPVDQHPRHRPASTGLKSKNSGASIARLLTSIRTGTPTPGDTPTTASPRTSSATGRPSPPTTPGPPASGAPPTPGHCPNSPDGDPVSSRR
jgi:hypothetical protein